MKNTIFNTRLLMAAIVLVFALLPILSIEFPPSTDLPQHLAQVRIFTDMLRDGNSPYVVQWIAPNNLIYFVLFFFWELLTPEIMAKAALVLVASMWIIAIHVVTAKRGRPPEVAILASVLVFNHMVYWGFLNFLIGFPVFVIWFLLTSGDPKVSSWKAFLLLIFGSFLLYSSHALWFAAGALWLAVVSFARKAPSKILFLRFASLIPCGAVALIWFPKLSAFRAGGGFDVAPHWPASPFFKLSSIWWRDGALGGIKGIAETIVFIALISWLLLSLWQNRNRLKSAIDKEAMLAALFFSCISLAAPDKYMNTISFAARWIPVAMIFLMVALPAPSLKKMPKKTFAIILFGAFCAITAKSWIQFEKHELSGLKESLDLIDPSSRVLGLDLYKESAYIKGRPFLQVFSYAQVLKGCEVNFSFASHGSGLVAYRKGSENPWTRGLEWYPERVQLDDFGYFDFILINGADHVHERYSKIALLSPLTSDGCWRLYSVIRK